MIESANEEAVRKLSLAVNLTETENYNYSDDLWKMQEMRSFLDETAE